MKRVRRNRLWSFLLALCLVCNLFAEIPAAVAAESGSIPAQKISKKPAQITMSMAEDDTAGQTAMAFSWVITDTSVEQSELVYYKSDAPDDPVTVRAEMKVPDEADVKTDTEVEWGVFEPIHAFIAVAGGLTPGETYCYKVGNAEDGYSDIATFTAPADPDDEGAFSFVVSADTQSNTEAGYSNTKELYDYIAEKESDAAFLIHTGDMVEDGNVSVQWEWFFEAAERLTSSMPMMTTPGNHEGGHHDRNLVNYKAHTNFDTLTAPEGLSEKTQGTIYSFEYGDALFVCLNTDAGSDDNRIQLQFLADQTARTDKTWKIVFMHVPPYDPGNNHYNINNTIGKYLSDAGVDLVLNGHEHVYARNTLLTTEAGFKEAEPGDAPTYVIGGSVMNAAYTRNSKSDLWSQVFVNLRKPSGSGIYAPGVYARVDVSGDSLTYKAYYKADGENFSVIDTFTITKDGNNNGEPVEKAPLEIDSADDLVTLSKMDVSDRDIVLTKDIDMTGQTISPVNGSLAYNGTFDGQGHIIKNLTISHVGDDCTGLIGYVGLEGQIKNLGLENVTVSGGDNTGAFAGCLVGSVSNCYVTGTITGTDDVGGITGLLHAGTIEDCWVDATITCSHYGGGLFGTTDFRGTNANTESPLQNELTGRIETKKHKVVNNLVLGTVSGSSSGAIWGDWAGSKSSLCERFTGNALWTDSGSVYGYLSGSASITTTDHVNVYSADLTIDTTKTFGNFSSRTAEQLGTQSTYETLGWDFDNTWTWDEELGHPILKQFAKPEAETVTIKTADDLVKLSERADVSNVNIRLANDVDMTGKTIAPIGGSIAYNGTFNGQGHVIKNLTISNADGNCTGLIGYVGSDGVVKKLALENVSITGGNSTGGVAGALLGTVSNCCVTGAISGAKNVGGITGILHAGTIENCWTDAAVTAVSSGGGLFGTTDYRGTNGKDTDPSVLMNDLTGPITDRGHKIINNLVMGTTLGSTSAILGDWAGSKSSSGTGYTGNVLWLDSVATGKINGWTSDSAKLATQDHENVYCSGLTLAADRNKKTASLGNYTTRTAEELRAQETYAALGWDFENTWTWSDKLGHPVLKNITEPAAPVEPEPEEPGKFTSLVTTFAGDAKTTRAFTWHTDTTISASVVQAVEKANYTDETSFAGDHCIQVTGTSAELRTSAEGDKRNIHHANLTGLAAGTTYCYRVGDGDHTWSDVYTFTTEAENTEEFTFFHITDTQASSGNYRNYKSVLDTVSKTNPEGAFILHSGDVIQNNQTSHYDAVYETVAEYTSWLPSMVAPGNHEMEKDLDKATGGAYGVDNPNYVKGIENFKSRYLYPDNGPEKSKQLVYSFDYGNAHFAALNTNNPAGNAVKDLDGMATQIEWLKRDMNASDKTWKMVYVHVGPYNSYGDSLPALATALDELGVDVVFFGHNHIFMRSNAIEGGEIMELNMDGSGNAESGTVYYSSGSANSSGTINEKGKEWFAATQATSSPTYGVIRVTENTLTIDTYQLSDTEPMDSFTIKKETASCSAAPIAKTGLTATESAQELVTAGTAAGGTMVYSLDGESWSESIPVAAEAGTYTVWYKVKGDAAHNDSVAHSVSVTIAAAQGPGLPSEDGEIPRSVTYLWDTVSQENGTFSARFNWITDADEAAPSYLFYAEKSAYDETGAYSQIAGTVTTVDLSNELDAKSYTGGTANYEGGDGAEYCYAPVKSYKAETPELKPNTEYVYRVGSGENGSTTEWKVIKTPAADTDTFDFLFFTDAQQGACGSYEKTLAAYDTLEKTLTQATTDYPDAAFIMSGGDQVNYGIDTWEWDAFFASNQGIFSRYPLYLSTGNHECDGAPAWAEDESWTPVDQTCSVVRGRYNPPENGVAYYGRGNAGTSPILTAGNAYEESKAGNYYFIYGDTLFLVMDFQDTSADGLTEAQQEWVKAVVENNPTKWRVAIMHKTLFGYRVDDPTTGVWRSWSDTFDEADIDLVLMGHDHVYARTKYYSDGAVTASQEDGSGTTYITGACANAGGRSDRYTANKYTLVNSTGSYGRSYVAVSISPEEIRVTAKGFDKDGQLITVENNALVTDTPRSVYAPASKVSLTAVSVTGAAKVGQTLTASPVPASATVAYQWERSANNSDWTAIDGAAALSYTITEADAGAYLRCTVTGTGDYQGTVSSTATEMIVMPVSGQKIRLSTVQEFEDFVIGFGGETYPADGNYELTASIDMTGKSLQPIGSSDIPFVGTFDGKGHTISNLTIRSGAASVGLFAYVAEGGHVTNVMLENLSVSASASKNTGAIAGACAGTIEQCSVTGAVIGNGTVGGLVGRLHGGTVKNCMVDVAVASSGDVAGGLVASTNYGGPITAKNEQTGNTVLNNLVLGTVNGTGNDYTGAVVGDMGGSKGAILKSFAGNVINAAVTANTSNRIAGYWSSGRPIVDADPVNYAVSSLTTDGIENSAARNAFTFKSDAELSQQTAYEALGWDFTDIWTWDADAQHPVLCAAKEPIQQTYQLKVTGGTIAGEQGGTAEIAEGTTVTVTASVPTGKAFVGWTVAGLEGINSSALSLTFQMPANDVTLSASFRVIQSTPSEDDSPSSGNHSSHGGTSSTTSTTQKNPDGSTTTTTTNKITGTVTETTKTSDGVTGTIVTNKDGETTKITVNIPGAAAKEAAKEGGVITVPMSVTAAEDTNDAVKMEIKAPASSGEVKVEIPVEEITSGTVAVIVNEDGTEEIVKTSVVTQNGVVLSIEGNTAVKIVDSSKEFIDVHPVDHWAEHAIDFVVARGIYSGTSETTFHPNNPMTRGMLAVVLYRLEDAPDHDYDGIFTDVVTGSYYEDGIYWAADNGIVGGYGNGLYGPNDNITREQLAVMLWRYAGSPESDHSMAHFTDANKISAYAQEAVEWANEKGIINGKGGGILDPKGNATRAQVAQMLMNFINTSK